MADPIGRITPLQLKSLGYYHNRYLDSDGRLGFNAGAHSQSVLSSFFAIFSISRGQIVKGGRHYIFFAAFEGPLMRGVVVQVPGE